MVDSQETVDGQETTPTDSVEQQMQRWVREICAHPPFSPDRQRSLNQLVNAIMQSGKLGHPQRNLWPANLYEDLYHEALQKTLMEICQKIDQYNPEHPVMAWVNFRLNCQFIEVVKDYQKQGLTQMPRAVAVAPIRLPSLEDLPLNSAIEDEDENLRIRQFLQQDPEGHLQKQRLRERPEITFQQLAIAKFIEGKSWPEIAADLNISPQTLCSFFNRQLKTLIPYFKKHLEAA